MPLIIKNFLLTLNVLFFTFGLFSQDKKFGRLSLEQFPNGNVQDIIQDKFGFLWIGTTDGLGRYDGRELNKFRFHPRDSTSLGSNVILNLEEDNDGNILVGTRNGINIYLQEKGYFKRLVADTNLINSGTSDIVHQIIQDQKGYYWYGTYNGLFRRKGLDGQPEHILPNEAYRDRLPRLNIWKIHEDQQGNIWIGTYSGLNLLGATKRKAPKIEFDIYGAKAEPALQLSHSNVFAIMEDSFSLLWVGTFNGLNYLDLNKWSADKSFKQIDTQMGLPHSFINDIEEIRKGEYWVATHSVLAKMYFDPTQPENLRFESMPNEKQEAAAIVNSLVYTIQKDGYGNFWFGTFDGLSKHYEEDGKDLFENYKHLPSDSASISNNAIRCLFLDSKKRMWVGTRSGLNYMLQTGANEKVRFQNFGLEHGLPNDVIHFVEEDEQGLFWVATNAGLVHFDPELALKGKKPVLKIYDRADGLAASSFVFRASGKDQEGNLYVGTANGLNSFHPDNLKNQGAAPRIRITKLQVLNKEIKPTDQDNDILSLPIHLSTVIKLKYNQNFIDLDFSVLDYYASSEHEYAYQLLGLDKDWVEVGTKNIATYTDLAPGKYTFQVKGANSDGIWTKEAARLQIIIQPPWWKSNLAYLTYFLLFIGSIIALIRFSVLWRTRKLEQEYVIQAARAEERVLLRQQNAADFHDELGHRLTKISLFLELAERHLASPGLLNNYLGKIKKHATGLSVGIRDMIWALDPEKDNLLQTLIRLRDFGDQLFDSTEVRFQAIGLEDGLEAFLLKPDDRKNMLLLFKEAMTNTLKHASANKATLKVILKQKDFFLQFEDDGLGIKVALQGEEGYGLKNMQQRAQKIGAQLEIRDRAPKGTIVILSQIPHMG